MSETTTPAPESPVDAPARESGRHPVNVGHLVMGIAFLGLVAVWVLIVGDVVEDEDVRWLLPAPWVLGGAAGLVALAVTGRRGRDNRQVGWVGPAETAETAEETGTSDETATTDVPTDTPATDIPATDTPTDPEDETR